MSNCGFLILLNGTLVLLEGFCHPPYYQIALVLCRQNMGGTDTSPTTRAPPMLCPNKTWCPPTPQYTSMKRNFITLSYGTNGARTCDTQCSPQFNDTSAGAPHA